MYACIHLAIHSARVWSFTYCVLSCCFVTYVANLWSCFSAKMFEHTPDLLKQIRYWKLLTSLAFIHCFLLVSLSTDSNIIPLFWMCRLCLQSKWLWKCKWYNLFLNGFDFCLLLYFHSEWVSTRLWLREVNIHLYCNTLSSFHCDFFFFFQIRETFFKIKFLKDLKFIYKFVLKRTNKNNFLKTE